MTDHNARQAGLTDERSPLLIAFEKYCHTLMKFKHRVTPEMWPKSWPWFEAGYLAAHSADARNGEGVALTDGYALVPLVPTAAMIEAWNNSGADDFKISDPNYSEFTDQEWSVWKETNATKDWQAMVRAAPAAPAPKCSECKGTGVSDGRDGALIPCLACKPAPAPAAQAGYHVRRSIAMRIAEYFGRSDMNSIEDVEQIIAAMTIQYTPTPSDAAQADDGQCDGCGADLGDAYCAGCLVDAVPKWLQSIKDDGYRTDNERCAAEILLKLAAEPRQQSATPADAASEADTARIDFHLAQNTTWYPGRGANGNGILCYGTARHEVQAPTWREAIDAALQRERQQGGS